MKHKRPVSDNRGAAIVSVLVVTVFITVIATTLLYISAQNYQMKLTDYSNKQSFYGAEETLDALKAQLVMDVQEAFVTAYEDTMQNCLSLESSGESLQAYYEEAYAEALVTLWDDRKAEEGDLLAAVQSLLDIDGTNVYKVGGYGYYQSTNDEGGDTSTFALQGVRVKCTKGLYTTFLYTDICLEAPQVNFITSSPSGDAADEDENDEREIVSFTDYVVYMNWRKADYDGEYNSNLGELQTQTP